MKALLITLLVWMVPAFAAFAFPPTSDYAVREIEGWPIRVNKELLDGHPELAESTLKLLQEQLAQIVRRVPAPAVAHFRKVTIWVEFDDPKFPGMCYHPSRQWLSNNGLNPDKAKGVELANAEHFRTWMVDQPWMVLHELAHSYHDQVLGYQHPGIHAAYEQAVKSGKYESVLYCHGEHKRHYALNNDQEYFAEATEAYFGANDFYPFVRAELKEFDPQAFEVLQGIWKD